MQKVQLNFMPRGLMAAKHQSLPCAEDSIFGKESNLCFLNACTNFISLKELSFLQLI